MPESWKCSECGLVNFASDANCKRCGATSASAGGPVATPAGIVLQDGYVLPPPPTSAGIWSKGSTLVMDKNASLPDLCVKCNAPAHGLRIKRKLSWHHPLLYILICGAALFYVILAMALSKRATIDFGICENHKRRRRKLLNIGLGLLAAGLILPVVGFGYDYPAVGLFGLLLLLIAIIWLVVANQLVNVKRIDDRYVWLSGMSKEFVAHFPPVPGGL